MTLEGQWLGESAGTNNGWTVLEVERRNGIMNGSVLFLDSDPAKPGILGELEPINQTRPSNFRIGLIPIDQRTGAALSKQDLKDGFPDIIIPETAQVVIQYHEDAITASWSTKANTSGSAGLTKQVLPNETSIQREGDKVLSWSEFEDRSLGGDYDGWIFRGQAQNWPLSTSFHRTGRCDMNFFIKDTLQRLQPSIFPLVPSLLSLDVGFQNSSLLGLAQHHGFPTPLLDWSKSPYIAAFFGSKADKGLSQPEETMSIFALDLEGLSKLLPAPNAFSCVPPYLTAIGAFSFGNPRLEPQQGILTASNLKNIEGFTRHLERQNKRTFLKRFDVDTTGVRKRLRLMGITPASMLPGLDGVFRQASADLFDLPE